MNFPEGLEDSPLSNCCKHKCDLPISQLFGCNFWRVFVIWNLCLVEAAAPPAAASVVRIRTISGVEVRLEPELFISLLSCVPASTRRLTISGVALGLVSRL